MSLLTELQPLDEAVRTVLAAVSAAPVGLVVTPEGLEYADGKLVSAYAVVYPLGGTGWGDLNDPDRNADLDYQVTSVGRRVDHARWMADQVRKVFLDRTPGGDFVHPIAVAGLAVTDRLQTEFGPVEPGEKELFSVADTFTVKVSAA